VVLLSVDSPPLAATPRLPRNTCCNGLRGVLRDCARTTAERSVNRSC